MMRKFVNVSNNVTKKIMENNTNWTPFPDDNLLGIVDKNILNEYEAKGLISAELYIFE